MSSDPDEEISFDDDEDGDDNHDQKDSGDQHRDMHHKYDRAAAGDTRLRTQAQTGESEVEKPAYAWADDNTVFEDGAPVPLFIQYELECVPLQLIRVVGEYVSSVSLFIQCELECVPLRFFVLIRVERLYFSSPFSFFLLVFACAVAPT